MNDSMVERVAEAVLYEGYLLYPYRPSSLKNRQRWTFGGVYPRVWGLAQGGTDVWEMQSECLVLGGPATRLRVRLRFLHLLERTSAEQSSPLSVWQEATEREIPLEVDLGELVGPISNRPTHPGPIGNRPYKVAFSFPAGRTPERRQQAIEGVMELAARQAGEGLLRLTVCARNLTPLDDAERCSRDEALLCSFVSTHAILHVRDGSFVSLTDPPEALRQAAAQCRNVGAWPVLVGDEGTADTLLCSPIILPDYPQVAPESPGDLFDASEIDEILTLRILTLTEDEKRAMRADERTRRLLERTEALAREQLLGLHGTVRRLRSLTGEAQP